MMGGGGKLLDAWSGTKIMLIKLKLYGILAAKYGEYHYFQVSKIKETIRGMSANYPDFYLFIKNIVQSGYDFQLIYGNQYLSEEQLNNMDTIASVEEVKLIPVLQGSGAVGKIILGVALIALSAPLGGFLGIAPLTIALLGGALALGGISQLLSPTPKQKTPQDTTKIESGVIDPQGVATQGVPVPLVYGTFLVGSQTISAGISLDTVISANTQFVGG